MKMDEITARWQADLSRDMAGAVVALGMPDMLTLSDLLTVAPPFLLRYLNRAAARRQLGEKLRAVGYEKYFNPANGRGRWAVNGKQIVVYRLAGSATEL